MVRKDSAETHSPGMKDSLVAKIAETRMAVHNLDVLPDHDVSKYREEGEDSRECAFSIDNQEGHVIYFKAVGQVTHSSSPLICVGNNDDLVAAVDQLLANSLAF